MDCDSSNVQMSHCAEDSETTIEINIKTLDSQTYNLRVNKCVPVPLLKEKIATVTGILSEQQRLICRGRVLKDDELLSAYHVEDGHTLHLVVRQPGQPATSGNAGNEAPSANSAHHHGPTVARSIVLEAVNLDQGGEFSSLAQILQSLFSAASGGPAPSDTRPSEPTQPSFPNGARVELDQQQASLLFPEATPGSSEPNVIPDSLTTISQYIEFMRDSFRREGFNENGQPIGNIDHRNTQSAHVGGTQNQESQPDSSSAQHGLPTASLLAETMYSTRQLLVDLAGPLLSQLSAQLGDLVNVSDSATRRNLQHGAMRHGVLLQNLGSLLLELGRTTMMLRINPAPSEAVVNSGPAVFISPSGPNPLMVPPVPFFPGARSVQMGPIFSSLSSQGSVLHPREADIHARTSNPVFPVDVNVSNSSQASPGQQNGQSPLLSHLMDNFQWIGSASSVGNSRANVTSQHVPMSSAEQVDVTNRGAPEVPGVSNEGIRFANFLQQIMPFISQVENQPQSTPGDGSSIPSQVASGSSNSARDEPSDSRRNSHDHNRDPVDGPNSKRQRTSD
ncbi:large proline-rich protein bag6 isoform X2 [Brachypodium distachyon]|uniref:Ubiquitin-like domain-containing protein n=1 Tax=Brachypodium distachyon TaxID=15368 RepID=A0A0Q3HR24_BRADI|nr:large proline-rich protein bag6 isoform X2 [Brachypodium distachyon]KQJ95962.1 hypothetical protein BRADI_3g19947v3 [Brachypodium distachyon]|eukprot:XP_014756759.1 large proline-rich protein bag6 isoform X2 [Brachypodium distachyon]